MSRTFKRIFDETAAPGGTEYLIDSRFHRLSRSAAPDAALFAGAGAAANPPAIPGPVSTFEQSSASDVQALEKAVPFGLPCITDEKLLVLMAQNSVNGRLAALHSSDSSVDPTIADEPATVPIAVGGSATGVVDIIGDFDDLTVALVAGQRYLISLRGTGADALGDSYLQIFDPSLVDVGRDDDGGVGSDSLITLTAAVSGTYTIRASAYAGSGTGQYAVDVRQMGTDSVPATIEGAVAIGQGITFGFRETATVSLGADTDYYKVSLVAGQSYSFSVAAGTDYLSTFNPIAAGEIDTFIRLRGPTGTILASSDDISWPTDASSSFQFNATSTGDYYLEVTGFLHAAAPGGNTGGYVIDFRQVQVEPLDPLDSLDWGTAANIPTVLVDGVRTAYIYFAAAGENFGENAVGGDPTQPASGGNGTLVSFGWTEYEKAQFMLAMQEYTKILGIAYVETANSALATFKVITNSSYAYGAYAYPQDPAYGTQKGIMVFNVDNRGWNLDSADPAVTTDGLGRGGYAWHTILHEAGHAHGLAHPHDTGGGSDVMVGVNSPSSLGIFDLNQGVYTQMSYNGGWQTHPDGSLSGGDPTGWRSDAGWLATMGAFDIAVLQARYGVTPAFATGDNVYTLKDVNAEGTYFETIYDTGGTDTIAYDGVHGAQIDLNTATLDYSVTGGGIVSFVRNLPGQTAAQAIKGGFTIANGVVIENATGGSGNDLLIGNGAANVLTGNGGNDVFMGGGGADTFRGESGDDTYHVEDSGDLATEEAGEGTDTVRTGLAAYVLPGNVENLIATTAAPHDFRANSGDNMVIGGDGNDFIRLQDGGNDSATGGLGNDVFLFGSAMNERDSVSGGAGLDQIALQGGSPFTFGTGVVGIESIGLLSGADTRFGGPGGLLHSYGLTTVEENVASGVQLTVDGAKLRSGEDLTFNGSAETDGSFFIYGGRGVDTLTGGAKNDVFLFGSDNHFGASDVVNGGPGGTDQLALRGSYSLTFGASQLIGIESIGILSAHDTRFGPLGSNYSYNLTTHDNNVASGVQMTVDGAKLRGTEALAFNGSAESDGSFRIFGGINGDTLTGGQGGDILQGQGGADMLTGGGGADTFTYASVSDSSGSAIDRILDFTAGTDKIDLSRIDANGLTAGDQAFSFIGSNAFSGAAGQLRAYEQNGSWFVEGDVNGDGNADLVIQLTVAGGPLNQGDFLP